MTQRETGDAPWWESEMAVIRDELRVYAGRRLRAWPSERDDVVGDTLLALTRMLRYRPTNFPASWFARHPPVNEEERAHLHRLARVILQRRVIDVFRKTGSGADPRLHEQATSEIPEPHPSSPEKTILLARLVAATNEILAEMAPEDRRLISIIAGDPTLRRALDDKERQRLHRARVRLRNELIRRTGHELQDLLKTR